MARRLLYADSGSYGQVQCTVCQKPVSTNHFAMASHARKHVRAGEAVELKEYGSTVFSVEVPDRPRARGSERYLCTAKQVEAARVFAAFLREQPPDLTIAVAGDHKGFVLLVEVAVALRDRGMPEGVDLAGPLPFGSTLPVRPGALRLWELAGALDVWIEAACPYGPDGEAFAKQVITGENP